MIALLGTASINVNSVYQCILSAQDMLSVKIGKKQESQDTEERHDSVGDESGLHFSTRLFQVHQIRKAIDINVSRLISLSLKVITPRITNPIPTRLFSDLQMPRSNNGGCRDGDC
jgi:hypothetical protein